jgi:putative transposase
MSSPHKYNPAIHRRRSVRLRGYDYSSPGYYFITICTQNRACLFGDVANGQMQLNDAGKMVMDEWEKSAQIRNEIRLDDFIVMPNHFHGIAVIASHEYPRGDEHRRDDRPVVPTQSGSSPVVPTNRPHGPKPKSIAALIAGFKCAATKRINQMRGTPGITIWQQRYWDHIVRDNNELFRIRHYIRNNPSNWERDILNGGIGNRVLDESAPT